MVREKQDQVERGRIGPVHVLEDQDDGRLRPAVAQLRERLLEHAQLRAPAKLADRTQRLHERLERQLRADEVDRAPDEHLDPGVARPPRELGDQPRLADPGLALHEDGRAVFRPGPPRARARALPTRARVRRTSCSRQ